MRRSLKRAFLLRSLVKIDADAGDKRRCGKHDDRKPVFFQTERIAADRAGNNGGNPRNTCEYNPGQQANLRQPGNIGQ
ncbi:hypothetical protein SDC9_156036 [bioreactor metagenome]|uniref:Uncharacterized protein n=1 Tax=bioreactor metagenome TaxID=1076179 RepID=A0A645F3D2_9ZZZZ